MIKLNVFDKEEIRSADIKADPDLSKIEALDSHVEEIVGLLEEVLFGQEEACWAIARCVARHEAGLADPHRPLGVLIFLGQTGVGKTEAAKALAHYLHDDEDKIKIIDCATLNQSHTIYRFLGAPPGYVGYGEGILIDDNDLEGENVVIFDEIEKADPAVCKLLLSIMENGRLTVRSPDPMGLRGEGSEEHDLDFSQSYLVFTSNVGAQEIHNLGRKQLGFHQPEIHSTLKATALNALYQHFAEIPEFLGRVDEIIVFKPLTQETYRKIFWKFIDRINLSMKTWLSVNAPVLTTTTECADYLIQIAVKNGAYGARDMRHVINRELLQPLSEVMWLTPARGKVIADIENGKIVFYKTPPGPIPEPLPVPLPKPPPEPELPEDGEYDDPTRN